MTQSERLPVFDLHESAAFDPEAGMFVLRGMTYGLKEQLLRRSCEDAILERTPRDQERFASIEHINNFETKGVEYYPLVEPQGSDSSDILAGLMWLQESRDYPDHGSYTLAIRVYDGFNGRGLGGLFLATVLEEHKRKRPFEHKIWLNVAATNEPAQRLYRRCNFSVVATQVLEDGQYRFIMSRNI